MKLSIKQINFKDLLVNHAEKVVFGLAAVIAVWVLLFSTSWTGYDKEPSFFEEKVERSEATLAQNNWPEEKALEYNNDKDVRVEARRLIPEQQKKVDAIAEMLAENGDIGDFDPSIYQQAEPIKEPTLLAMREPIASVSTLVMALAPDAVESEERESTDPGAKPEEKEKPEEDEFKIKKGANRSLEGQPGEEGIDAPEEMVEGGDQMGELLPPVNSGKGERFISIRMVFPLYEQYEEIAKASHKKIDEIKYDVVFTGFQLQRKEAIAGQDPWAGEWKDVDIEFANKVLDQAADFDSDELPISVKDIFTMPLPMRLMGSWTKWASHPRIEKLSKRRLAEQEALKKSLVDHEKKFMKEQDDGKIKIKGFKDRSRNFRQMGTELMQSDEQGAVMNEMESDFNQSGFRQQGRRFDRKGIEKQLTASGQLLLFRYLDFDVKPGKVYRYRARLELKNPNLDRPLETVERPSVREGLYRNSKWSDSTSPVVVPPDVKLFVGNVNTPLTRPNEPTARMEVFHWLADVGTIVHKQIDFSPGDFLSKKTEADVLKPGAGTFPKEEVTLGSAEDVLVDIDNENYIHLDYLRKIQNELKLGTNKNSLGTTDQILVVDKYGRMIPQNAIGDRKERDRNLARIKRRDEANKDLKEEKKNPDEEMEGGIDLSESAGMEAEMDAAAAGGGRGRGRGRRRNSGRIVR